METDRKKSNKLNITRINETTLQHIRPSNCITNQFIDSMNFISTSTTLNVRLKPFLQLKINNLILILKQLREQNKWKWTTHWMRGEII